MDKVVVKLWFTYSKHFFHSYSHCFTLNISFLAGGPTSTSAPSSLFEYHAKYKNTFKMILHYFASAVYCCSQVGDYRDKGFTQTCNFFQEQSGAGIVSYPSFLLADSLLLVPHHVSSWCSVSGLSYCGLLKPSGHEFGP